MDASTSAAVGGALRSLALKDMDPSLLGFAIVREGAGLGVDTGVLQAAMEVAAYLHRDDQRGMRRNLPVDTYVTHPFRLVLRLIRYTCDDGAVLSAAALHDTVEDHAAELAALLGGRGGGKGGPRRALDRVAATFGPDVARIVGAVTNEPVPAAATEDEAQRAYRDHVAAVVGDPQVFLVKFADFVDNAGSLRYMPAGERRNRLARKYGPLVPTFRAALAAHGDRLPLAGGDPARLDRHLTKIAARIG
jgi:hypothetical protein